MKQDRAHFDRRHAALKMEREQYIDRWREASDYISPFTARFLVTDREQSGRKKASKILDDTAGIANTILTAGLMSGVTNPSTSWLQLRMQDPELGKVQGVKVWLESCRKVILETFLNSNFYGVLPEVYHSLAVYGTAAMTILEHPTETITAEFLPIGSYWVATNGFGEVDTIYRESQYTVAQLVDRFGLENCSVTVQNQFKTNNLDTWHTVIHAIEPNLDWDDGKLASRFQRWLSVYYEVGGDKDKELSRKGFREFPAVVPRWESVGGDAYGFGPGLKAIGDIKSLQVMERKALQAVEKQVSPPLVAPVAMRKKKISSLSGDLTFVDETAENKGIREMYKVNLDINALEMKAEQTRTRIKKAFFSDLFLLISSLDKSGITATEIAARKEEQLLSLGPVYLKLNDEFLDNVVERTFAILLRAGKIPPPPPEIQGKGWAVEYISIMAQSMKAVNVTSMERAVAFIGSVAQSDPSVLDGFSADDAWEEYASMTGIPPRVVRDAKTRQKIRAQRAQQDQAAQSLAMAQQGADVAQKLGNTPLGDNNAMAQIVQRMQGAAPPMGAPA